MDKVQETKLQRCFLLTSAKAKKFQDGNQSIRLYNFSATFIKNCHNCYQKDSRSFLQSVQKEVKRSILQDYEVTHRHTHIHVHTHTHIDCYMHNPPPTLGLIIRYYNTIILQYYNTTSYNTTILPSYNTTILPHIILIYYNNYYSTKILQYYCPTILSYMYFCYLNPCLNGGSRFLKIF